MKQTFTEAVGAVSALNGAINGSPRKKLRKAAVKPVKRAVTSGIVCFCGDRFAESQALEFMLHLRAELGRDLAVLQRQRERYRRRYAADPERFREKQRERSRRWRANPASQERARERARLLAEGKIAPQRPRSREVKERDARAAELRQRGLSYRQIAQEVGLSPTAAFNAVRRAAGHREGGGS